MFENNFTDFQEAVSLEKIFEIVQENTLKCSKLILFLGNKNLSSIQNVWRDHATMQQDVLLHFYFLEIFFYWNQAEIRKKIFFYPALELFYCLPLWKTVLFVSARAFSLSTPVENSEATWKKATKCNKPTLKLCQHQLLIGERPLFDTPKRDLAKCRHVQRLCFHLTLFGMTLQVMLKQLGLILLSPSRFKRNQS